MCLLARLFSSPFVLYICIKCHRNIKVTTVLTPEDCRDDQFFCDDDCHSTSLRCNGHYDCLDRKDEQNCPLGYPFPTRPPPIFPCPQHTCSNGKCFSENERCDGTPQCDDGSDEANCKFICISNQKSLYATLYANREHFYIMQERNFLHRGVKSLSSFQQLVIYVSLTAQATNYIKTTSVLSN